MVRDVVWVALSSGHDNASVESILAIIWRTMVNEPAGGTCASRPLAFLRDIHGVVPKNQRLAVRDRWTWSYPVISILDDPLVVSSWVVIAAPNQQLRITIHQPALTSPLRWGFMSCAIAIFHRRSLYAGCHQRRQVSQNPAPC